MGLLNLDWLRQMQAMQGGGSAPLAFQPQSVGQAANNMQNLPMNNAMDGLRQSMQSPGFQMGQQLMGASAQQGQQQQQEQDAMAQQSMAMFAQRRAQDEERRRRMAMGGGY